VKFICDFFIFINLTINRPITLGSRNKLNGFLSVMFYDMVNMFMLVHYFKGH
jgi:hypothetical protein